MPKFSQSKCEATCQRAETWLKSIHATGLWFQAQEQNYNRKSDEVKKEGVWKLQSKSGPQPCGNAAVGS